MAEALVQARMELLQRHWATLQDACEFVDWQRLRVQEAPDEVPPTMAS